MGPFDNFADAPLADVPLASETWFRLGGSAAYYARPTGPEQLASLISRCREVELPWRLLAGGTNVLVRDEGVPGLVIHLESPAFADVKIEGSRVIAGAAVPLTVLISQTARAGLAGLESLTGIPGTLGAAVRGNSGGRQGAVGTHVRQATVLEPDGEVRTREHDDLEFTYRASNLDDSILLSAVLELEPDDPQSVVKRMRRIWIVKKENQPYGHQSSGCIFRNPSPELTAGMMIEGAGLKGLRVGGAEVSDRHANYIIAEPGATTADVLNLIDRVRDEVARQHGLVLGLQIRVW